MTIKCHPEQSEGSSAINTTTCASYHKPSIEGTL